MHKYLQELQAIAESKGGKLLSTEYINSHAKYKFLDELGNEFEAKGYSIKNGRWSPHTAQKRKAESLTKYTIDDLKTFAESKGGKCLSDEYVHDKTKYSWSDSKDRHFVMEWSRVKNGQWSPFEKSEKLSKLKQKFTTSDLIAYAKKYGGEFLSNEYDRYDSVYKWKDRDGKVFYRTFKSIFESKDLVLYKTESSDQENLKDWIASLGFDVKFNDKSLIYPKELDIFIPSLNIAVEYHGLIWHSEARSGTKTGHLDKLKACKDKGIDVIQIFNNEWLSRPEQVKSFLKSKLGVNRTKIFARKCEVRSVDKTEAKAFLDRYHIQGGCAFVKAIGLYKDSELLALMTVGHHHRNPGEFVLSRFVCKEDVTVVGGLSRLTQKVKSEFGSIVTWVDLRWSNGESWIKNGWELEATLPPDYFYINLNKSRIPISKQSRKKSVVGTPEGITEHEHAKKDGLSRVWDCGKLRLRIA